MRKIAWGLALLALAGTAMAGPINTKDIAPGAKWAAHLDVQGLVASQVGQYVLGQIRRDQPDFDTKMAGVAAIFGVNPLTDLASITIYGAEFQPAAAVVILKGKCDKEKLLGLLKQNPNYSETAYGTYQIQRWTQNPEDAKDNGVRYGAFHDDGTVIISRTEAAVKTAMDTMDGKVAGVADVVPPLSAGVFFVAAIKEFTLPPDAGPEAQILRRVSGGLLTAGEAGGTAFLNATLSTRKAQDAQRLRQMLTGGLAFLSMATELVQEKEGQPPFWAPLIDGAQVGGNDDSAELHVAVQTQTLIRIADEARKADQAKKAQGLK